MTRSGSSDVTGDSLVVAAVSDLRRLADWLESSRVARTYGRLAAGLAAAAANSRLTRLVATLVAWIRASYLYRWLTEEPDPDVIVIDLRETYTVGPAIALLDRLVPHVASWWRASAVRDATARTVTAVRTAPIRAASVALLGALGVNTAMVGLTGGLSTGAVVGRLLLGIGALAGTRVTVPWSDLRRARTIQVLVAALEPPEPPDDEPRK